MGKCILGNRHHAMKANLICFENDAAIEDRVESRRTMLDLAIPKLELAAPMLLPWVVQVQQEIETAMQLPVLDKIEINMDIQVTASASDMNSSAHQLFVSEDVWNVGDVCEIGEKLG